MSIPQAHFTDLPHLLLGQRQGKVGCSLPAQGFIQVHVYTSNANFPLEGASVSITRRLPGGGSELISFQSTDSSGNTQPVAIETPALSNSQSPNQPVGFSDIDVAADHPLYERVVVDNVQIFPGVTTLQDIQLLPMDILPDSWGQQQEFDVTPQNL